MVDFDIAVVVDNLWIRPDGNIQTGRPRALSSQAYLPSWMLRVEGWAFVGRTGDVLRVQFDPRCVSPAALRGILDAIRGFDGGPGFHSVEIQSFEAEHVVSWSTGCTLAACCRVLEVYESVQALDEVRHAQLWQATMTVETQSLDLSALRTRKLLEPCMLAFLERWRLHRSLEPLIDALGEDAQFVSVYRVEEGDPRAHHLGGSLIFTSQDPRGARLIDIMPAAQAKASRERIAGAVLSGQPLLRRHRSETYDLMALSVPILAVGAQFTVTMTQLVTVAHPAVPAFSTHERAGGQTDTESLDQPGSRFLSPTG